MNKTTLTTLLLTIFFSLNLVAQNTYFVKVGGNNSGGLTEENAFTTVNNAVVAASDGDIITIVGAINQTGQVGIGKSISFVGQSNATITGASARMYVINTAGKTISFTNITFQDADSTNPGAVFTITQNSDLTLTGCILKNNTSTVNGGAILAGGTGVITITNSLFDGNSANRGGAVAVTSAGRQLIVTGSTFVNNTATGIDGGALYLAGNNNLSSITNTTIFNNQVNNTQDPSKGGGVKIEGTRPFTIQNSLIYGNFVTNGTTDVPSDLGVIANVELNLINSLTKKITPNLAANDSFATSIVAADLTASNLSFDSTTGNVIYDAVVVGTESPIDFGSDGEDAGSWNSGLTLLSPDTTIPVITLTGEPSVTVEVGTPYTDAGATASDNIDGDITSTIITVNTVDTDVVASYTVTYNVSDASGNAATEVTRTVNVVDTFSQNTYFVKVGGNNNGGLTEENAFTTVNNAVVAASDGDTIIIVGSINQTGQVGIGKSISFVGQSDATITGASARMYVINTAGKTISFTNITFQDADSTNPGAVFTITQNSDLTLTGCILKNNTSTVNGGAILAGGTGVITITNSLFDGNSANRGGAVAVTSAGRQLIVTGSTFVNNTATGIDGGALYLAGNNNLSSITNTTIFNNQVNNTQDPSKGGGVKIEGTRPFTIQNSLIYGNFVTNGTTDVPSDLGVIANVELNLINSLTKKITPNLAANDSFATSIVAADLTASNLSFDSTTGNVIYDAVVVGTESPIDFGSDGEDAGSWNSGLNFSDTTIPVITLEGEPSVTVEVGTSYTDAGATASDNIDGDITSNIITVNTVDTDVVASYTVTYNVSDASGNAATEVTRTVNVVDTTIPVITLTGAAIVTIEVGTTYVDGGATATDNYDDDTALTASIVTDVSTVDTTIVASYTVTYNVSDASGNAAVEVTRTVNVVDTTIPVITLTGTAIVTIEVGTAYVDGGATATDNYDDNTTLTASIVTDVSDVDAQTVGSYTVSYNVSDVAGNAATEVTRTVNVVDTTVPVISLTGAAIVTIEVGTTYVDGGATATDNYDDNSTLSSNIITVNTVDTDVVASYTVTYNVSDASGNAATEVTRTVNVVDTTVPVITLTGTAIVTIEVGTTYVDGGATATDNYDDDTVLTASIVTDVSTVDTQTVGSYTVSYNVSDASGNAATEVTRTVNVVDTTVPVITLTGAAIVTIEVGTAYVDGGATATDNYDDDTVLTASIVTDVSTVDTQTVGSYTVSYNVSDASGNAATEVTRTVNVVDTTVPVITLTGAAIVTIEVGTTYVDGGATATDNYDDDTALTASIVTDVSTVDTQTVGSYTVSYNVSDASGNAATEVTRTVNVVDTTVPVITLTGAAIVTIEVGTTYVDGGATATDNYDDDDTVLTSNITTDVSDVDAQTVGSYTVSYNVSDASGNAATEVTRTVNVVDTTVPVITLTGAAIVTIEVGTTYVDGGATATDNYDDDTALTASIVTDVSTVDTQTVGSYTVSYNVSDASGNAAVEVRRTVNVEDSSLSSYDGDNENLKFIIYPNPTSDKLYIKGLNNYDLKVYNRLGQIILKANNTHAIDVSSLSVGIYLIEVSDGVKSSTKRFVKY